MKKMELPIGKGRLEAGRQIAAQLHGGEVGTYSMFVTTWEVYGKSNLYISWQISFANLNPERGVSLRLLEISLATFMTSRPTLGI